MKGATNMKKLLKLTGTTIALTAIGVAVRAKVKKNNTAEKASIENGKLTLKAKDVEFR